MTPLEAAVARAAAESPLWSAHVRTGHESAAQVADGLEGGHALGVEMIREGYLLHRDRSRGFDCDDAGERLLVGDYLYAAGLREICATGDLGAVAALAELISACAAEQGRGGDDGDDARWRATLARLAGHA